MKYIKLYSLLIVLFLSTDALAIDRCKTHIQEVRRASSQYLGIDFPYHYQIGCMKQESNCRADVVSFDGGVGYFQLTPSTGILTEINKDLGVIIDPYKPADNIRAQAYYISKIINKYYKQESIIFGKSKAKIHPKQYVDTCGLRLWYVYQQYNGGWWWLYEASKADYTCDRYLIQKECTRGGVWIGKDKKTWLSFCEVNYSYPIQIDKYSKEYKLFDSKEWKFWGDDRPSVCGRCHK